MVVTEIETAGATTAPPPPKGAARKPREAAVREEIDVVDLAAAEIRPHLLRYTLIALAFGFVAGRILR